MDLKGDDVPTSSLSKLQVYKPDPAIAKRNKLHKLVACIFKNQMSPHFPKHDSRTYNEYVNTVTKLLLTNLRDCPPGTGDSLRITKQAIRSVIPKGMKATLGNWGEKELTLAEKRTGWTIESLLPINAAPPSASPVTSATTPAIARLLFLLLLLLPWVQPLLLHLLIQPSPLW
jgi:hypothetical protein